MEIELKYFFNNPTAKAEILNDPLVAGKAVGELREIAMEAHYLDTPRRVLGKNGVVLRARRENDGVVATVKWGGKTVNGLHERGELNVDVPESFIENPDVDAFKGTEVYDALKAAKGKRLEAAIIMEFTRREITVKAGKSICVVSVDEGKIVTKKGEAPILEAEIELEDGNVDDITALGDKLREKYDLIPANDSKYKRGIALLEKK